MSYPIGSPRQMRSSSATTARTWNEATAKAIMQGKTLEPWDKAHGELKKKFRPIEAQITTPSPTASGPSRAESS
ncbi:hypothetical protein GS415_10380 [Rhodococcus hoagii]|nr:hypothetical protein [Prescottella equi]